MENRFWDEWKAQLCHLGIKDWVASFLEIAGPFSMIVAQFLVFATPFLYGVVSEKQLEALSRVLEEPVETRAFANYLKES